jgi:hypothetical protein
MGRLKGSFERIVWVSQIMLFPFQLIFPFCRFVLGLSRTKIAMCCRYLSCFDTDRLGVRVQGERVSTTIVLYITLLPTPGGVLAFRT